MLKLASDLRVESRNCLGNILGSTCRLARLPCRKHLICCDFGAHWKHSGLDRFAQIHLPKCLYNFMLCCGPFIQDRKTDHPRFTSAFLCSSLTPKPLNQASFFSAQLLYHQLLLPHPAFISTKFWISQLNSKFLPGNLCTTQISHQEAIETAGAHMLARPTAKSHLWCPDPCPASPKGLSSGGIKLS